MLFWAPLLNPDQHQHAAPPAALPLSGRLDPSTGTPARTHPDVKGRVGTGPGRERSVISCPGCHSPRNAHASAQAAPTGPSLLNPPDYDRRLGAAPAKYFSSANPPLAPSLRPCLFVCLDELLTGRVLPVLVGPYTRSLSFQSSHLISLAQTFNSFRSPPLFRRRPLPLLSYLGCTASSCLAKVSCASLSSPRSFCSETWQGLSACFLPWILKRRWTSTLCGCSTGPRVILRAQNHSLLFSVSAHLFQHPPAVAPGL